MTAKKSTTPMLDNHGKDLTQLAKEGKLDPVIGREREVKRLSQILARRKKNNPIIVGEAGVGKTAIVEGLAQMIVGKTCPRILFYKKIITLDLSSVVAGTKYRGQFEERLEQMVHELKNNPNIIIFIDEIHTMIGAGGAGGAMDAANILKPALSSGELQCIGATTLDEYRLSIEKDAALNRRFQKVLVDPSTPAETMVILNKLRPKYENHHSVKYTEEAIDACVTLSERYLTERFLPDKAIDLLDEAGANVQIEGVKTPEEISEIETKINVLTEEKNMAAKQSKYELAAEYRDKVIELKKVLEEETNRWKENLMKNENRPVVTAHNIGEVISSMTGIPVSKIEEGEIEKLSNMKKELNDNVVGQSNAVERVCRAIHRSRAGLKSTKKPIGTFIFLGPTGVGKTELAKQIAKFIFDSEDALIRIDMNDYSEQFTASRLFGAPPGYVGYEDGGELSEKVKRKPYSVILLDEIEKAHPSVFNHFLRIFDEGIVVDSTGRKIDFRNTIIIMTSNVGVRQASELGAGVGFKTASSLETGEAVKKTIKKELMKQFPPEFINRIDEIVYFDNLSKESLRKIIEIELTNIKKMTEENGYSFILTDRAKDFLIDSGYDEKFGARHLNRSIKKNLEDLLAENYIDGNISEGDTLNIDVDDKNENLIVKDKQTTSV